MYHKNITKGIYLFFQIIENLPMRYKMYYLDLNVIHFFKLKILILFFVTKNCMIYL